MGIRLMTGSALQSYSQWRSRRKLKEGARVTEDAKENTVWSPAPIVYGIVNNNLLPSHSMCVQICPLSRDAESPRQTVSCSHHLLDWWDCVAMMTCDGPPLSPRWLPIPASTDMATASAAARELRPLGPTVDEGLWARELCWMTGAGEPVGSDVSFMCSSPERQKKRRNEKEIRSCRCKGKNHNSSSTYPSRRLSSGGWWQGSLYELTATALDEPLRFADETPHSCTHTNKWKQSVNMTLGHKLANTFVSTHFQSETMPTH